jgi:uncharacterized membrane protein
VESIFSFLFKYRPLLFQEGRIAFGAPIPVWLVLLIGMGALGLVYWSYNRARGKTTLADRLGLMALRSVVVLVVLFCLMRPLLVVTSTVPKQNFLAVLIDDSRSMQLADSDDGTRSDQVQAAFDPASSPVIEALAERFQIRTYRFGGGVERVNGLDDMTYAQTATRIGQALDRVREELSSVPLSGIVLVSDGADAPGASLAESLVALRASEIPVYAVGVGGENFDRDIEIVRATAPRSALQGSSLVVDVTLVHRGFGGQKVPLQVEDGGQIIALEEIELPRDNRPVTARVRFALDEAGARRVRFRVPPQQGERITENNARDALIRVRDGREKILYFEGEPRFEVKFLRRAVAQDENLQLVLLQRTAEGKFLRLDVDSGEELVGGFPATREELFQYRALVIGSVEASYFTHDQLRMIEEFVSRRGGGLLMLGGRRSFAEGGWAGTPVADALPLMLGEGVRDSMFVGALKVALTREGASHFVTQIGEDEKSSAERWRSVPELTSFNRVGGLKPGATALLSGSGPAYAGGQVVLAHQRYGRGQALAFTAQDSWMWRMHADVPVEDRMHETFWRQVLRWLVSDVPDRVDAVLPPERTEPGQPIRVVARVADKAFNSLNTARVLAEVTTPVGGIVTVPLDWTVARDGEFAGTYTPEVAGVHEVRIEASSGDESYTSALAYFESGVSDAEFFDAQLRPALLRRVAEETGGRYYAVNSLGTLPEDIRYTGKGVTRVEEKDLWDMPILFLLLVGMLGGEWVFRRMRGLA